MNVYRINDCDWYIADSLSSAIAAAVADTTTTAEDLVDDARQLTENELDGHIFYSPNGEEYSFREELQKQINKDPRTPRMFATTEF